MKATDSKVFLLIMAVATVLALILLQFNPTAQAQNATSFSPNSRFAIPQQNSSISFAYNGTYTSATLQNNTWTFNGLTFNGSGVRGNLSISATNSNLTIYSFYSDSVSSVIFTRLGYLLYWADGVGTQTINLHLNTSRQTDQSEWGIVNPSGVFLVEGQEWRLLPDNTVVILDRTGNITVAHYSFNYSLDSNQPFYIQHSVALITIGVVAATVTAAALVSFRVRRKTNGN